MSTPPNPRHHGNGAPSHLPGRNGTGDTGGGPSRRSPLKGTARDGAPVRAHTANLEDDSLSLTAETIDAIANRVADLLEERTLTAPTTRLLTATELAQALGVTRGYVYDHAQTLGAIRTGTGTKPRLRFDPATVAAYLTRDRPGVEPTPTTARRRSHKPTSTAPLLPIRGQAA